MQEELDCFSFWVHFAKISEAFSAKKLTSFCYLVQVCMPDFGFVQDLSVFCTITYRTGHNRESIPSSLFRCTVVQSYNNMMKKKSHAFFKYVVELLIFNSPAKGQIISKSRHSTIWLYRFFGRIEDTKETFRNYLPFRI